MKEVQRSPDDEILLTELAFDCKNFIPYEVNSVILLAEQAQENPDWKFRCFLDTTSKEFFVEIANEESAKMFTKSALITIMKLAMEAKADTFYICVRKTFNKDAYLKPFFFLGFEKLSAEEQKEISLTRTHAILKCNLNEEDDD